jgi:prepilin-type N-terminal cleavage/methylation domain-containing protein
MCPRPHAPASRRSTERGFTLVEMLIALIIVGVLSAVLIPKFSSQRTTAKHKSGLSAAHQYYQAVIAFQGDHNGRIPDLRNDPIQRPLCNSGSLDGCEWPFTIEGPRDDSGRPYIRSIPTIARNGTLGFVMDGQPDNTENPQVRLHYVPLPPNQFEIRVLVPRDGGSGSEVICTLRSGGRIEGPRC